MALFEPANVISDPDQLSATVILTDTLTIGTITGNSGSGTVNVTTTASHFLSTGDYVAISGTTNFNTGGTPVQITVPTSSISSISGQETVTVDTTAAHGLTSGDYVIIAGTTNFNGTFGPINVVDTDTFTYVASGNGTPEATGTVQDVNTTLFSYSETNANADENAGSVDEALNPASEIQIDTTPAGTFADPRTIGIAIQTNGTVGKDGVTLKALYSFLKDRWKADADLIKFPFPMTPITDEQFEFTNGWNLEKVTNLGDANTNSQKTPDLIRTGGWAVNAGPGTNDSERWISVITLGSLDVNDQVYYRQVDDITTDNTSNFLLTGPVNQAVQYYRNDNPGVDDDTGDTNEFNYSGEFTVYVRTWEKTYAQTNLEDIGVSTLNYQAYRFPLTNAADVKITGLGISEAAASGLDFALSNIVGDGSTTVTVEFATDPGFVVGDIIDVTDTSTFNTTAKTITTVGGANNAITFEDAVLGAITTPETSGNISGNYYNNMDISWETTPVKLEGFNAAGSAGGIAYFKVIIDGDAADSIPAGDEPSIEQIYAWTQAQLRRSADINANTGSTGAKNGVVVPLKLNFVGDAIFGLGQSELYEGVAIADYNNNDINNLNFWGYGTADESARTVATIARSSNTVTVTVDDTSNYATGDYVTIAGTTIDTGSGSFNGTFGPITVTNGTTFTYAQTESDATGTNATGTVAPAEFTAITFPFSANLVINFGQNLIDDSDAIYKVFFTNDDAGSNLGRDFGTVNAIVVNDGFGDPIAGDVSGVASVTRTFAYDTNQQRGNSSPAPAPITAVAIGLNNAQYITATATINRVESTSVSLVAPLERNYDAGTV
jgi:aspartate 1-decarboxylase